VVWAEQTSSVCTVGYYTGLSLSRQVQITFRALVVRARAREEVRYIKEPLRSGGEMLDGDRDGLGWLGITRGGSSMIN